MRAVQGKYYGNIDDMITVEASVAVPNLQEEFRSEEDIHLLIRYATKQDRKSHMIIKTLAVALAPGDCRVLSGETRRFQGPPSFPYIPGGDCCGIVMETCPEETYFQKGDIVAARFTNAPRDGLAEYARVSTVVCEKVDISKITPEDAAALAGASPAIAISDYIRPDERVLILGAGGGVGSHLCQLAKMKGAYVCGVSQSRERLLDTPLNCDDAVDYTQDNIYESLEYQQKPFDTIIDLACGGWPQLVQNKQCKIKPIVKPASMGGRYITITSDQPTFEARNLSGLLTLFMFQPLWRFISSRIFTRQTLPTFTKANGLPQSRQVMTKTLDLANAGSLKAVIDGPYPMTTEGVRNAFRVQESRHGKGKVVVKVAEI
eukprot:Awhi_evm1s6020